MHVQSDADAGQPQETDAAIWAAFEANPRAGFERLYDCYAKMVYGLARTILENTQDAEDLTSEVFMSLLSRRNYDPARGSLVGFLCAMTRSRAIDRLRARKRTVRLLDDPVSPAEDAGPLLPADEASIDESAHAVREALAALPATQRRVIELAYFKGLTQVEIAEKLAAPLGSVKTWARQGLYGLRGALARFQD